MGKLKEDLVKYSNEVYTKKDIKAGIALLFEISGGIMLGGVLLTALMVWIPMLGIPVSTAVAAKVMKAAGKAYANMETDDRRKIRAVAAWVRGGVNFF